MTDLSIGVSSPREASIAASAPAGAPDLRQLIAGLGSLDVVETSADELSAQLAEILRGAAAATSARLGSLYMIEQDALKRISTTGDEAPACVCDGAGCDEPWARCEVLAHVAGTRTVLSVDDVANLVPGIPERVARFLRSFQCPRVVSLLAAPIVGPQGDAVGVLELLDSRGVDEKPRPFPAFSEVVVRALAGQAGTVISHAQLAAKLQEAQFETVFRLSMAAEYRDTDTAAHIQRMSRYTEVIAQRLGLGARDVQLARLASPMHDVGKLGIPDAILLKPGKLTEEEWHIMKSHTTMGARILSGSDSPVLQASEQVALTHHEKVDGTGYPVGLRGDEIPLLGRMAAVADAFDAVTSRRCYKEARPLEEGLAVIRKDAGSHFDPECAAALERGFEQVERIYELFTDPQEAPAPRSLHGLVPLVG